MAVRILLVDDHQVLRGIAGGPGVVGAVGMILGRHDVNIAGMQVGRHLPRRGGDAIMVLNVDDVVPPALQRRGDVCHPQREGRHHQPAAVR